MKSQCRHIGGLIERYHDNELSERERKEVEGHLSTCTECKRELKSLEGLSVLVREYGSSAAEGETFEKVWHGVRSEIGEAAVEVGLALPRRARLALPTNKVRHSLRLLYRPLLATALLTLLVLVWLFYPDKTKELSETKAGLVVVESVESSPGGVMVFNTNGGSVAVIWLFEIEEGGEEAI